MDYTTIEIRTLEELMTFQKNIKYPIIISETLKILQSEKYDPDFEIEVYDNYRE